MKHVGPARAELGFRTVFNLIGPLSNPASVKRYLLGVFSPDWVEPLANVLAALGAERAWVVHGAGGFDEISPAGETKVAALEGRHGHDLHRHARRCRPADLARSRRSRAAMPPTMPRRSAAVLGGQPGAYRDTVLLNAGAALVVAGRAGDLAARAPRSPADAASTAGTALHERLDRARSAGLETH